MAHNHMLQDRVEDRELYAFSEFTDYEAYVSNGAEAGDSISNGQDPTVALQPHASGGQSSAVGLSWPAQKTSKNADHANISTACAVRSNTTQGTDHSQSSPVTQSVMRGSAEIQPSPGGEEVIHQWPTVPAFLQASEPSTVLPSYGAVPLHSAMQTGATELLGSTPQYGYNDNTNFFPGFHESSTQAQSSSTLLINMPHLAGIDPTGNTQPALHLRSHIERPVLPENSFPSPRDRSMAPQNAPSSVQPADDSLIPSATTANAALLSSIRLKPRVKSGSKAHTKDLQKARRFVEKRQETAFREAKRFGAPESAVGVWCPNPVSVPKRRGTGRSPSSNKEACLYCALFHIACNGGYPCNTCREKLTRLEHQSSAFRWTCTIDFELARSLQFNTMFPVLDTNGLALDYHAGWSAITHEHGLDNSPDVENLCENQSFLCDVIDPLLPMLDFLEDERLHRPSAKRRGEPLVFAVIIMEYFPAFVKHKELLLFMRPTLRKILPNMEYCFHRFFNLCMTSFEKSRLWFLKEKNAVCFVLKLMQQTERSEQVGLLGRAIATALHSKMKNAVTTFWEIAYSQRHRSKESKGRAKSIAYYFLSNSAMSSHIPPEWRGELEHRYVPKRALGIMFSQSSKDDTVADCIYSNSTECCCGMIFRCLGPELRGFFGVTQDSFAAAYHPIDLPSIAKTILSHSSTEPLPDSIGFWEDDKDFVCSASLQVTTFAVLNNMKKIAKLPGNLLTYLQREILAFIVAEGLIQFIPLWEKRQKSSHSHGNYASLILLDPIIHRNGANILHQHVKGLCKGAIVDAYVDQILKLTKDLEITEPKGHMHT